MSDTQPDLHPQIKIGGHVLIQLGSELVTDVEQAILECVKNAYDADSRGCFIEIDTTEEEVIEDTGPYDWLKGFQIPTDTVKVELTEIPGKELAVRRLAYTGRVTISDTGKGIKPSEIETSWLVVSNSIKRTSGAQPKEKTELGRTPLGDKGLGRLGTMKIGDILRVESATEGSEVVSRAHFRWKDCEVAPTLNDVPVIVGSDLNNKKFQGTRVSVLGLNDLPAWRSKNRADELIASLAALISPFESISTFPVTVRIDGADQSLVHVTDELLKAAVAKFTFKWECYEGKRRLVARAAFKRSLFTVVRSRAQEEKIKAVFGPENGDQQFLNFLSIFPRTKGYATNRKPADGYFIEFERTYYWSDILMKANEAIDDPGDFTGAFYFFHIDKAFIAQAAISNTLALTNMVKRMAGISLLRDGFRIRSSSDWLGLSEGMTSGSTYGMRYNNTVGYFALTGEQNYLLVEKSDREGFVENPAYRGFHDIAKKCLNFSNEALESVRRAMDERFKQVRQFDTLPQTAKQSVDHVEDVIRSTEALRETATKSAETIGAELDQLLANPASEDAATVHAVELIKRAVNSIRAMHQSIKTASAMDAMESIRRDQNEQHELVVSLIESAAVGLSARGLAHELRTHLTEIRKRLTAIQKATRDGSASTRDVDSNVRAIKLSCSAIASQASLLDPMLPRSRAMKDNIIVYDFIGEYVTARDYRFQRDNIRVNVVGKNDSLTVRINQARLLQVIDNLVNNSIYWLNRANQAGDLKGEKVIEIVVTPTGFTVSDSGLGVDPHYEASLFELFVSAKPSAGEGQGLGLFIARQLLAMDGCEIYLDSARNSHGRMYRFVVNLSAVDARKN